MDPGIGVRLEARTPSTIADRGLLNKEIARTREESLAHLPRLRHAAGELSRLVIECD